MKKALLAASVAFAAMASAANATVVEGIQLPPGTFFDHFEGKSAVAGLALNDVFNFSLAMPSVFTSASLDSSASPLGDLDFTNVNIDGIWNFGILNNIGGFLDLAGIAGVPLAAGNHTLSVTYNSTAANVTYSGNIAIVPVPEPATWALMIVGIAAIGTAMRRRAQKVRVSFS